MAYQIYSLEIPPRLLRTINGGQSVRAADTDLDGRVEIWTDDAHAVDGFEGFSTREMAFVPAVVLRFERGQLFDVSSEFKSYFDDVITKIRTSINSERLRDFRASDGKLRGSISLPDRDLGQLRQLQTTKLRLLEILWAYLYSGREQDAWRFLTSVWPPQDTERIRSALLNTRARGIISLVDGSSTGGGPAKRAVKVYRQSQVRPAQPIMVRCYPRCGEGPANAELSLNLVIDSAGKVRSVHPNGAKADETITRAAEEWKFIPAFRSGRSVASHLKGAISALR